MHHFVRRSFVTCLHFERPHLEIDSNQLSHRSCNVSRSLVIFIIAIFAFFSDLSDLFDGAECIL